MKEQFVYRAFSKENLKSRASIPNIINIVAVSDVVDHINCTKIRKIDIQNLLSDDNDSIGYLCSSPNINPWSGFSPIKRFILNNLLTNRNPTDEEGYTLGDFAGYNHNAIAPHYESSNHGDDVECIPGETVHFNVIIHLGEAKLVENDIIGVSEAIRGLALTVWNGANILTRPDLSQVINIVNLNDIGNDSVVLDTQFTIPSGTPLSREYVCKIFICNNLNGFSSDLDNAICQLTELPNYTKLYKILAGNHFFLNGPENNSAMYGMTFTSGKWNINTATFNTSNGTMMVYYVKLNTLLIGSYNHLHVKAWVETGYFDKDGIWIGTMVTGEYDHLYDGSWNQNTDQAFQVTTPLDIWDSSDPINTSGKGYRIVIDCNPSTI